MAEVKWIKITTNIFDDEKMKLIDVLPERDAIIVIWFKLLAMAGKTNDNGSVYVMKEMATTDEVLSTVFNRPLTTVRLALQTFGRFGMIEVNEHINIVNWDKHQNIEGLDKIREQNRIRQAKHRESKKLALNSNVTSRYSNAIDIDKELDKNKKKKNKEDIEIFFEEHWKLYPKKQGKGSISDSKKSELYKLGDEFKRCIDRYIKQIKTEKTEKKYIKNGSTFFNSGYIDYLDKNYTEIVSTDLASTQDKAKKNEELLKSLII